MSRKTDSECAASSMPRERRPHATMALPRAGSASSEQSSLMNAPFLPRTLSRSSAGFVRVSSKFFLPPACTVFVFIAPPTLRLLILAICCLLLFFSFSAIRRETSAPRYHAAFITTAAGGVSCAGNKTEKKARKKAHAGASEC